MEQKFSSITLKTFAFILVAAFFVQMASASGISRPYWDDNPLRLAPGEETVVTLNLQNMAGTPQDVVFKATLTSDGGGIASLIDGSDEYTVPFGRDDVPVRVRISVPESDQVGGVRTVGIYFDDITPSEGGMVSLASAFSTDFPVEVVVAEQSVLYTPPQTETEIPQEASKSSALWWLVLVVVVVLVVWLIKKSKKK